MRPWAARRLLRTFMRSSTPPMAAYAKRITKVETEYAFHCEKAREAAITAATTSIPPRIGGGGVFPLSKSYVASMRRSQAINGGMNRKTIRAANREAAPARK